MRGQLLEVFKENNLRKMPPLNSPATPLLRPVSLKSPRDLYPTWQSQQKMNVSKKKLIPALIFVLVCASVIRFLRITISTSSHHPNISFESLPVLIKPTKHQPSVARPISSSHPTSLSEKELRYLVDIVLLQAPCNLLIFGFESQYLVLAMINVGGTTIFLEDNPDKLRKTKPNSSSARFLMVGYNTLAKEAYRLLKHSRAHNGCTPHSGLGAESKCKLALTDLAKEVTDMKWDVIVVDGPKGDGPETPGRMASIYTAGILARTGNITNVVVHDVDRMIEKWFSWEFLCDKNLVSSKGKFWHFRIAQDSNSTSFCPA